MRFKTKRWIGAIAVVLVAVALCAVLGNISEGFQIGPSDWKLRKVNADNLYQSMTFQDTNGVLENGENGITVKLLEDNVIDVNGTAGTDLTVKIASTTLKKNTAYVFDGSLNDGSNQTMYVTLETSTGTVVTKSYTGEVVIPASAVTADTEVYLTLHIAKDTAANHVKLRPILCEGADTDDAVAFYK